MRRVIKITGIILRKYTDNVSRKYWKNNLGFIELTYAYLTQYYGSTNYRLNNTRS